MQLACPNCQQPIDIDAASGEKETVGGSRP